MWSLVTLDKWSSYTVIIVWELAWVDSALVTLDVWLSYRGGRLNRFDCNIKISGKNNVPLGDAQAPKGGSYLLLF